LKIIVHRGTRQIGGSCVEIESGGVRILIDLGTPLDSKDPGDPGVRPDVIGVFAGFPDEKPVDAIIISHAHQDHYGLVNQVRSDVPVYLSPATQKLIELTGMYAEKFRPLANTVHFDWRSPFEIGPFRIIPHLVDHSAFDAFAFEIAAGGKRVFYSGDFRDHGRLGKTLDIIRDKCPPGVDALIMEGTMLGRADEEVKTEDELSLDAAVICRDCHKAVFVYQSGQNVTRAVTFHKAAMAAQREFVPDIYMAHVLSELGAMKGGDWLPYPGNPRLPGIRAWRPQYLRNKLFKKGHGDTVHRFTPWHMTKTEMRGCMSRILVQIRPGMQSDLRAIGGLEGSVLIYSQWAGYMEEKPTKDFLCAIRAMGIDVVQLHTSGHATVNALQRLVDILQPKTLIPIHTEHAEQFGRFGVPLENLSDGVALEV
jgi:ribonuclease J